jgi:hypothetical protein
MIDKSIARVRRFERKVRKLEQLAQKAEARKLRPKPVPAKGDPANLPEYLQGDPMRY